MDAVTLPGGSRFYWHGAELEAAIRQQTIRQLYLAVQLVENLIKKNISVPSASGPSKPGEYPHADTGTLRNSIFSWVDENKLSGGVGTNLIYGLYLEYGTAGGKTIYAEPGKVFSWIDHATGERVFAKKVTLGAIRERSYLRRTLAEAWPQVQTILAGRGGGMRAQQGSFLLAA